MEEVVGSGALCVCEIGFDTHWGRATSCRWSPWCVDLPVSQAVILSSRRHTWSFIGLRTWKEVGCFQSILCFEIASLSCSGTMDD